jgi:hypothetical protein
VPSVPPKYEEVFRLTSHLIQKHSSTWTQFMTAMQEDAKMVAENRLPLPLASTKNVAEILEEVSYCVKNPDSTRFSSANPTNRRC